MCAVFPYVSSRQAYLDRNLQTEKTDLSFFLSQQLFSNLVWQNNKRFVGKQIWLNISTSALSSAASSKGAVVHPTLLSSAQVQGCAQGSLIVLLILSPRRADKRTRKKSRALSTVSRNGDARRSDSKLRAGITIPEEWSGMQASEVQATSHGSSLQPFTMAANTYSDR